MVMHTCPNCGHSEILMAPKIREVFDWLVSHGPATITELSAGFPALEVKTLHQRLFRIRKAVFKTPYQLHFAKRQYFITVTQQLRKSPDADVNITQRVP